VIDPSNVKATKEPEQHEHDDDQAEHTAEARQPVTVMRVIPAAAAEKQDQNDGDENEAYGSPI